MPVTEKYAATVASASAATRAKARLVYSRAAGIAVGMVGATGTVGGATGACCMSLGASCASLTLAALASLVLLAFALVSLALVAAFSVLMSLALVSLALVALVRPAAEEARLRFVAGALPDGSTLMSSAVGVTSLGIYLRHRPRLRADAMRRVSLSPSVSSDAEIPCVVGLPVIRHPAWIRAKASFSSAKNWSAP